MTPRTSYTYSVLRYVHDVVTGEFLNVGVLFHAPGNRVLLFRTIIDTARLSGAFPGMDSKSLLSALARLSESFAAIGAEGRSGSISAVQGAVLPKDDSSLQWSPSGAGLSDDLPKTFGRIFERHVSRYEQRPVSDRITAG